MGKVRISNKEIIGAVAGTIYRMHPYHNPEGIDKIIGTLNEWCDKTPDCVGNVEDTFKLYEWEGWDDFKKWLDTFLKNILEFRQLNISKALKEKGVNDAADERNQVIKITDRYTIETQDERYTDFIDLDACIQNIVREIDLMQQIDDDCFLCKYAEKYGSTKPSDCEICNSCLCNPKIRYHRVTHPMALKPKKDWTEEEKEKYNLN